jgi:hypothetical protein
MKKVLKRDLVVLKSVTKDFATDAGSEEVNVEAGTVIEIHNEFTIYVPARLRDFRAHVPNHIDLKDYLV